MAEDPFEYTVVDTLLKAFIINNETIQVIYPKIIKESVFSIFRWRHRVEDLVFEIKWNEFEKIVLRKKTLKKSKFGKGKTYRILKFIGNETKKNFILNRFHETKQIEITLLLENYAKKMGKEYIEK